AVRAVGGDVRDSKGRPVHCHISGGGQIAGISYEDEAAIEVVQRDLGTVVQDESAVFTQPDTVADLIVCLGAAEVQLYVAQGELAILTDLQHRVIAPGTTLHPAGIGSCNGVLLAFRALDGEVLVTRNGD